MELPMRSAVLALLAACTVLSAGSANAKTVVIGDHTYVWLEPASYAHYDVQAANMALSDSAPVQTPRAIYEHAFFTPTANYQQTGYQCAGMVSVSFKGGVRHLHRGTYCIR